MSAQKPALFTRPFFLLVAAHFLQGLCLASMLLLPLYLDYLGASRTEIGTIMATATVGSVLARPACAWALDMLGRKRTLAIGTVLLAAAMASLYLITEVGPGVYVVRLSIGAGVGSLWTGYFTFAADIVPGERRTEGIALFGLSGLAPLMLDPLAGEAGLQGPQLRVLFPIIGAVTLSSLLPLVFVPEKPRHAAHEPFSFRGVAHAAKQPVLRPVWVAIAGTGSLVSMFMAFATVAAEKRHVEHAPALWFTYALGAALVRIGGGTLPDRVGPARIVPFAFAAHAIADAIAVNAGSTGAFLAAGFFAGACHGIAFPILTSLVVTRTPEHLRGSAVAMLTALWESSALVFTPAYGAIADHFGDAIMFTCAAGAALAALLSWWPLEHRFGPPRII